MFYLSDKSLRNLFLKKKRTNVFPDTLLYIQPGTGAHCGRELFYVQSCSIDSYFRMT